MENSSRILLSSLILIITFTGQIRATILAERRLCDEACKAKLAEEQKFDVKKETELYELRRQDQEALDNLSDDINQLELTLQTIKSNVKIRLDQMHQIVDSNLNQNKVFRVTVDNLNVD